MDADDTRKMIALLEEIRDGQQLQLRRQGEALERQTEALGMQRQHYENLQIQSGKARELQERAEKIPAGSARLIGGARVLVLIVAPLAVLLLVFVCWMVFSRLVR